MAKRFEGKVAIVTGSSNGIGRATAVLFAREGAKVTLTGRNETALTEAKNEAIAAGAKESDVLTVVGDLREENVQKELVDRTVEKFGKLDILIHNAGGAAPDMTPRQGFQMTINDYDYIMELNLRAIVSLTNLAREHLVKSKGEIVVVSSIAGLPHGNSKMPYYAISKAGLDQYMRALAVEMIEHGVRVNGVNPGIVRTTIIHKQGATSEIMEQAEQFVLSDKDFLPSRTIGLPEDIAKAIAFLADRNSSSYIIGHSLVIDGGSNLISTLMQMDFAKVLKLTQQQKYEPNETDLMIPTNVRAVIATFLSASPMIVVPYVEDVFVNWFRSVAFDDAIDRLNYVYTASLMYLFAIVVSAKQYAGTPIQCWVPGEFECGWRQYVEDYCFIQNTFFVPFEEDIPSEDSGRTKAEIGYYQWVPIVLALQAIMFYMPSWLWATLHKFGGLDLTTAMTDAGKIAAAPSASEDRKKELSKLSLYLEECLEFGKQQRTPVRLFCFRFGRGLGSYVTLLYLLVKGLYVTNILTQFYILNRFLGSRYSFWGIQTFVDLYNGREWMDSGVFPRVTLCDFQVRRLGNIHRYTVQCVLSINMINEKIYLFLWFWFLFVAVVTAINFFYTVLYMSLALLREKSTRQWLMQTVEDENKYRYKQAVRDFCHQGLGPDGVLTLRFIESHAGGIVVRDVAAKMFNDYIKSLHQSSTKTTSPDIPDDGAHESCFYMPSEPHSGLVMPDYPTKVDH